MEKNNNNDWLYEISPKRKLIDLNFEEIWQYRDLLILFVKRDIVTVYKQTILGPLWFFIQPLFTSVIFTLVFNNIANIPTGNVPPFLFNLAGITAWNYFNESLTKTSNTFTANAGIFGKVYFPRVIMPLKTVISGLFKFGIQLLILIVFYFYFFIKGYDLSPNSNLMLFPVYVLMMALLGLGAGMIISAFTSKYRDLTVMVGFATSLLMYISAVPYPLSEVSEKIPQLAWLVNYNPLAQIIEGIRYMILDTGIFSWSGFFYTLAFSMSLFLIGLIVFNKTEKNFIDTV
ncbi:ABC transporter permease [Salegentibacter mishustinae]|uniref:Transport permease protein n=1 Tax=Salegentibacter mishustinae TaxID=270918 RepID=A0A0Q9Z6E9_9FLAO|nr:ABC transporter permease [Salegentibacter mishustinae]KRG28432.1 ABC transporter permease [Salegentibacter mishustinae]PNW22367.1 ABC transporter permease [Salegentibacter mishustinae]PZX67598.1 lipopolysaccharide transport system permease protein [Salegentibacter mishustinae]GGW78657.1 transport permease protein [Salegentibacter mishustinae]